MFTLKRKPLRRRMSKGGVSVNTSDLRVTSVSYRKGWVRYNKRDGWHIKLPLGYMIQLSED